jgi:hypothetical protein
MSSRKNKNQGDNSTGEQNVFSGNEEKSLTAEGNLRQDVIAGNTKDSSNDEDVYRSRNLEIEKERD